MIQPIEPRKVIVTRNGQSHHGELVHSLYLDTKDKQGNVVGTGKYIGTAFRTNNGMIMYAQPDQVIES